MGLLGLDRLGMGISGSAGGLGGCSQSTRQVSKSTFGSCTAHTRETRNHCKLLAALFRSKGNRAVMEAAGRVTTDSPSRW